MAPPFTLSSSRTYLEDFARRAGASVPDGAMVLDAGAGTSPYAEYFAHTTYESADHRQGEGSRALDYECDLTVVPVDDNRYDLVFLSQVLEHVPGPEAVIKEMARILKPGGTLWLSTPLFYQEHEQPYDFFRYTQFGLTHLLGLAGMDVDQMDWLEGYLGTLGYQTRMASRELPTDPAVYGGGARGLAIASSMRVARPILRRTSVALDRLDSRHRITDRGMPKNYTVVGRKRS
jgi:SAM-dependent methyltransferase